MEPSPSSKRSPWLILFIVIAVVIGAMAVLFLQRSTGSTAPVLADFGSHQKVTESSTLYMAFDRKMDAKSVAENLELPEDLKGKTEWKDNVLTLKPSAKLKEGATYTVRIPLKTLTAAGKPLNQEKEFRFTVAGAPKLSTYVPGADSKGIPTDSKIVLVFDRPLIPLSAAQGSGAKKYAGNWPVQINPDVSGRWRWVSTTVVEFIPEKPLTLATVYTVTVPKGIITVTGDKTEEEVTWSFETSRPVLTSYSPHASYYDTVESGPDTKVRLNFNQPIDLKSARSLIEFSVLSDSKTTPQPTPLDYQLDYVYEEQEDGKKVKNESALELNPKLKLVFNSTYRVVAKAGIKGKEGALGTEVETTFDFKTVGEFKVEKGFFGDSGHLEISFSNTPDEKTLKKNIRITPTPANWEALEIGEGYHGRTTFWPELKPSSDYKVEIGTSVKDRFGQSLKEPYSFTFKTPALDPFVEIVSKGDFGIFESGKPPVYIISSVNVSRLDLEFARIPFDEFLNLRLQGNKDWNFKPVLSDFVSHKTVTIPLKNQNNEQEVTELDLAKTFGKLGPGLYALKIQGPEYKTTGKAPKPIDQYQYFTLTGLSVTLKYSGNTALVWVTDMLTGRLVKEAEVTFHALDGKTLVTGLTDPEGVFSAPIDLNNFITGSDEWDPEFWVSVSKENEFAFLSNRWSEGMDPWQFGLFSDFRGPKDQEDRVRNYLYTERRVYRPGDTVHFKGITRLLDPRGIYHLPKKSQSMNVVIEDSESHEVYNKTLSFNEWGSFSGDLPLDPEAPLGSYYIMVSLIPDEYGGKGYDASHTFAVLEYRKPEFLVNVTPEKTDYFDDEEVAFNVEGRYYFGSPMSEATVNWYATTSNYFFNRYTGDEWYSFSLEDAWCYWDCPSDTATVTEGQGKLNSEGKFSAHFPVNLDDKSVSQIVSMEVDVTDQNNQVVSNRESVPVHKAKNYVGILTEDYVVTPGESAKIKVITLNPDGSAAASVDVKLKLFRREWNTVKKKSVDGDYYYDNEPKDTFISDEKVTTAKDGKGSAEITIPSGGSYRILAEIKDEDDRRASADTYIYAYSDTYINWPHPNNDRIEIIADKPEYKVGDTAKVLIKSPYQGKNVKALITVERESVIEHRLITVESNAQPVEIPITEDLIPNAYVSAMIIKPREGETFDDKGRDTGAPDFKIGYVKLKIETKKKKLGLSISTDKPKYGPGENVTVYLKALDDEQKPVRAELSLGVVDMSINALLGFQLPDLVRSFYEDRGLGVKTAQMLTYLMDIFKPGSKGGGGGSSDAPFRKDFKDTAYWNPSIRTNEKGEATITFKLPDNLTTWHFVAVGQTKDHRFGASEHTVIETKDVILRPVRPRFALAEDTMKIGAIVHNFLDADQNFTVELTGSGFSSKDPGSLKQTLTVKAGAQEKLLFPIEISPGEKATFRFKAESRGGRDEIEETIPVYRFGTPQSVATSGLVTNVASEPGANKASVTEMLFAPPTDEAQDTKVTVSLAPTVATYLPKGLEYLVHFPYGCAEQTVSSFLPNVAVKSLQGFDAFKVVDNKTLEKNIIAGLERLYTFQRGDGGFGYWEESDKSYPYLTAYIVYALQKTKEAGYAVDSNVLKRALDYLDSALRAQKLDYPLDLTTRAYILFVLTEGGRHEVAMANNLYEKRNDLPLFARAYLAMVYQKTSGDAAKTKANKLVDDLLNHIKIDARGAHFEEQNEYYYRFSMNTNQRSTALILQALIRIRPDYDRIPLIVRSLLENRRDGHWDTTQSTVASIFALLEFLEKTGELDADFKAEVALNGAVALSETFNAKNILTQKTATLDPSKIKADDWNQVAISKNNPSGRLYYDLLMSYFLTLDNLPPAEEGMGVTREITPIKEGEEGYHLLGTYKVKLTITTPEDREFVAIESPLAAGFEALDFNLNITQQRLADKVNSWGWYFNHQEFRDDRVFLFADYLPAGVHTYEYLMRATTPGKFHYRPTRVWEMYYPENFGQTEGHWIEVKE